MKRMKFINICLAACVMSGIMSCSDDGKYDVHGTNHNLAYICHTASDVTECQIYTTPVGTFGDIETSVRVKMQYCAESRVTVEAVADLSLADKYNDKYGAEAVPVPETVANSINVTPVTIEKNTTGASENLIVSLPEEVKAQLSESEYVLPLRLVPQTEGAKRKVDTGNEIGVQYIHIKNDRQFAKLDDHRKEAVKTKTPGSPDIVRGKHYPKYQRNMIDYKKRCLPLPYEK